MKLGIFSNFGPPHIGGSEKVIEAVSNLLAHQYGYEITLYSFSEKRVFSDGKIIRKPCLRGQAFIDQINENDRVWLYSDSFWEYDTLVKNMEKVRPEPSVALVGAYEMRSRPDLAEEVEKHRNRINFIVHSATGDDYKFCQNRGWEAKVIPNGVDLAEFVYNKVDFRKKYNIKQKYILLNVSNFFYGKGQECLGDIGRKLREKTEDFVVVSISHQVSYRYETHFRERCFKSIAKAGIRSMFLRNLPREDVVGAFKASDVFVFPSRKEVAPLVILEARAAGLPWVSSLVGDVSEQVGGIPIRFKVLDEKGYGVMQKDQVWHFAAHIWHLLWSDRMRGKAKEEAKIGLAERDWKQIVPLYNEVFTQ